MPSPLEELRLLDEKWREVFHEPLPGLVVSLRNRALIKRCIRERDRAPLARLVERRRKSGIFWN